MDSNSSQNSDDALTISAQLATIFLAFLAVLAVSIVVLVFVIHSVILSDVTPRLSQLELSVEALNGRIERLEKGQQEIVKLVNQTNDK